MRTPSGRCELPVVRGPRSVARLLVETSGPENPPIGIRALSSCYEDDNGGIEQQRKAC